jgi:hypothetical protein
MFFNFLCIRPKQTAVISFMECEMVTYVVFHIAAEVNRDMFGAVTGLCGR